MKVYTDTDRKGNEHKYTIYEPKEMTLEEFDRVTGRHYVTDRSRKGHNKGQNKCANGWGKSQVAKRSYINIPMAFDIETTSTETGAYMYIWQLGICNTVVVGRTWSEFVELMGRLSEHLNCSKGQRVIVWVHNLSFEWQFIHSYFDFSDNTRCFFKEERKPLFVQPADMCFQFKDSLAMTNSSLARLAKDYCSIDKKKGDLDYSIERNDESKLTEEELSYCYNDVLILTEFAEWFWKTYLINHSCPLTCTGALYAEVKTEYNMQCKNGTINTGAQNWLRSCWNKDYNDYSLMMNFLYRGGYTHGGENSIDYEFTETDNVYSYDFTSSYPASMLLKLYPYKFEEIEPTKDNLEIAMRSDLCLWITATFYEIKRKSYSDHSIESSSKCLELVNPVLDNGRIYSADKMTVMLTELDYASYLEFYDWEDVEILNLRISKPAKLPSYLIKPMIHYAVNKNRLKHEGKPYALEKARLNTFYGLCVKKVNATNTIYNGSGYTHEEILNWEKETEKPLLPQWGVWISAHSRRNLLATVHKLEMIKHDVAYCDTDSLKIVDYDDKCERIINEYNDKIQRELSKSFEYYEIPAEDNQWIKDLGMYDCEGKLDRLKILGAKRYLYVQNGKLNQTVAGLPKTAMLEKFGDIDTCFEKFADGMKIEISGKLMSKYFDEPTTGIIAGKEMLSLSSVSLLPTDFTMTLDGEWLKQLLFYATHKVEREEIYE